jgi:hypothetical protein
LFYRDKKLTVKTAEFESSSKAVGVLTRGFIKLKSVASSSSQNKTVADKEKGSKRASYYNQGRSSRECSSINKQKPSFYEKERSPSKGNTDVQNTTKDAVNPGPGYILAFSFG